MTFSAVAARRTLVSVLTPTFNHGPYVRRTIESVLAQTVSDWELLVIDDGSTDDTVARALEVDDPRVRVVAREHVGMDRLSETFNFGLARTSGEFLAVVEGDDEWLPDKLEFQLAQLRDPSVVLGYARYAVIGSHGDVLTVPPLAGPRHEGPFDAFPDLLEDSFAMLVTTLIRRDALVRAGGFHQLHGHGHIDYATWLELALLGRFVGSDRVVARWRRHATSATVRAQALPASFEGPSLCRDLAIRMLDRRYTPGSADYLRKRERIERSWEGVLARRYWQAGRLMHAGKRWSDASRLFAAGMRLRSVGALVRAELAVGLVFSLFHLDLEALIGRIRGGSSFSDLQR